MFSDLIYLDISLLRVMIFVCLCFCVSIFVFVHFYLCIYVLCLDGPGNFLCQSYQDICHVGNSREFPKLAEIESRH